MLQTLTSEFKILIQHRNCVHNIVFSKFSLLELKHWFSFKVCFHFVLQLYKRTRWHENDITTGKSNRFCKNCNDEINGKQVVVTNSSILWKQLTRCMAGQQEIKKAIKQRWPLQGANEGTAENALCIVVPNWELLRHLLCKRLFKHTFYVYLHHTRCCF